MQDRRCVQVTETALYVAERFGGWQEAVLRHLASHFRDGAGMADFGPASTGLLDALRDHPDVKVRPRAEHGVAPPCSEVVSSCSVLLLCAGCTQAFRRATCCWLLPDPETDLAAVQAALPKVDDASIKKLAIPFAKHHWEEAVQGGAQVGSPCDVALSCTQKLCLPGFCAAVRSSSHSPVCAS